MPKLVFLGSKRAGLVALKKILELVPVECIGAILSPDDSSDVRNEQYSFLSLAADYSIPYHVVKTSAETSELIKRYTPDTVFVHGWYRMLAVSGFPGIQFLGFHFSLLPEYRGNAPLVWQIINGLDHCGVSFFVLTDGMDDGDIIDQRSFALGPNESIGTALDRANELVFKILEDFIPNWLAESFLTRPQVSSPPSYCGLRLPNDGLINWDDSANNIHNFIRAQTHPYPGAYSRLSDVGIIRFWESRIEIRNFYGVPGSVVEICSDSVVVACGSGALCILHAEVDGQSSSRIPDALRSLRVRLQ